MINTMMICDLYIHYYFQYISRKSLSQLELTTLWFVKTVSSNHELVCSCVAGHYLLLHVDPDVNIDQHVGMELEQATVLACCLGLPCHGFPRHLRS